MHEKKRLELIIERMALQQARTILETAGLTGYTVLGAMAGFGGGRRWRSGDLSTAQEMTVVIAIGDDEKIKRALDELHTLLESQIGVLSISTVEVLRPELFQARCNNGTRRARPEVLGTSPRTTVSRPTHHGYPKNERG